VTIVAAAVVASLRGGPALPSRGGRTAAAPAPGVGTVPVTPILSIRRLPDWIEDTAADQRLVARLPAALAGLGPAAATSCLVVTQGDRVIFTRRPTQELIPASNLKLLTATAVLDKLGTATRLTTRVTATQSAGGTVAGDLYLIGGGDPLLWTPAYEAEQDPPEPLFTSLPALAAQVRAAGVTTVDGSVVGDESLFDTQRGVATWSPSYQEEGDVGPLSALEVNNGFSLTPPYGPTDPALMAAQVFTGLLQADGVTVRGAAATGVSPPGAVAVTSISSAPLGQVVGAVLRVSDDTGAELLTKLLGKRFAGVGSTAAGVAVTRADLAADGLPVAQLEALDGSGLDRGDRVTCQLIADDLRHVGTTGALFAGLPVAGRTGTLAPRMIGTAAAGRVHAKTGTLTGVSALSGFVLPATPSHAPTAALRQPIVFSFITNGVSSDELGEDVGNAIGVDLAAFPQVAPLADALPRLPRGGTAR
jgi:serine-type D-Ala-D-Ala carboxypeptidase/endopeptidase (penicillin-binding protein 4)